MVAGTFLLGRGVVPAAYGFCAAHLAVEQFRAQSQANSLWDSARIRAYQRTLALPLAAPEAVLRVPRIGIEAPVLEGTSDVILNRGLGHLPGTALPGAKGNVAITGHRDGFLRPLKDIVPGDVIEVERAATGPGQSAPATVVDRYSVQKTFIVQPSDTSVLAGSGAATLTLITCYPFYFVGQAPQRFIVQATLLSPANTPSTRTH